MAFGVGFGRVNLLFAEGGIIPQDFLNCHAIVQGRDPVGIDVGAFDDRFIGSLVD